MYNVANELLYCPDCHSTTAAVLDHSTGDTICTECGLVLEARYVDETSEWRSFANDSGGEDRNPSRIGYATDPLLDHAELGTSISYSASHKSCEGAYLPRTRSFGPALDDALIKAFRDITDMADRLGLVDTITDRAKEVYKNVEEGKVCPRARSRDTVYAACIFIACRNQGKPRTIKELATVTGCSASARRDIGRVISLIKKHLGEDAGQAKDFGVVHAADYLRRFCSLLGMGYQEVRVAQKAALRLEHGFDIRRNPDSLAAAVIYMVVQLSGTTKTVREVSIATGVAEGTIKEAYKELLPYSKQLFR